MRRPDATTTTDCGAVLRCGVIGERGGGAPGAAKHLRSSDSADFPAPGVQSGVPRAARRGDRVLFPARIAASLAVLSLCGVLGCGTVTADPSSDAGTGGNSATGGAGGAVSGTGGTGTGGVSATGGAAGGACLSYNSDGFAYGDPCDTSIQENPSNLTPWLTACRANCQLSGHQFTGCAVDPRVPGGAVVCHVSCAECP